MDAGLGDLGVARAERDGLRRRGAPAQLGDQHPEGAVHALAAVALDDDVALLAVRCRPEPPGADVLSPG